MASAHKEIPNKFLMMMSWGIVIFLSGLVFLITEISPVSLGGALILIPFLGIPLMIIYRRKSFSQTLFYFSLATIELLALNVMRYLESVGLNLTGLPFLFFVISFFYIVVLIVTPYLNFGDSLQEDLKKLRRRVSLILWLPFFVSSPFIFIVDDSQIAHNLSFSFINLTMLLMNGGFFVSWLYMRKISDNELLKILKIQATSTQKKEVKKYTQIVFLSIVFVGSLCEIARGFWVAWVSTLLIMMFVMLISWKIVKQMFS
jgi:hypothetical protein